MNKYLAISLIIIALVTGIGFGYYMTPEYAAMQENKKSGMMDLGTADRYVDLRYIDGMIAHHLAAIYLAEQAKNNSTRKEVLGLSDFIIEADKKGIEELYSLKEKWYGNTRKITSYQKVNLGQSDDKFDLRFINALIAHHVEAIEVARDIQTKSTRVEILNIANDVDSLLSGNLQTIKEWRQSWYGIK